MSWRLAAGLAAGSGGVAPFAFDDFTGADLAAINGRSAPIGGLWAQHASYPASGAITANRMFTSGTACAYLAAVPPTPNYVVSSRLIFLSDNNSHAIGVAGRIDVAANTMYHVRFNTSGNAWELFKFVTGAATSLGTSAASFVVGQNSLLELSMINTSIAVFLDGVLIISATDAAISAAGKAGFRGNGTGDVGIGVHMDDFRAVAA